MNKQAVMVESQNVSVLHAPITERSHITLDVYTRHFCETDKEIICSWVQTSQALECISGDYGDKLTKEILSSWIDKAEMTIVVALQSSDIPVGFCTLSKLEAPHLPSSYIEICHLIVAPNFKHLFIGSRLCSKAKNIASSSGYCFVCGRVVPENKYTLALARLHHFEEIIEIEPWLCGRFRWFHFNLAQRHYYRS